MGDGTTTTVVNEYEFKVGDIVKIHPSSDYKQQAPDGIKGKIYQLQTGSSHPYIIRWDNGYANGYRDKDLILISGEPQYEIY